MSNNRDWNELVSEVGAWGKANFKVHLPWLGMVEELGEICHCVLKKAQKIRGFDSEDFFKEKLADAIGDLGIYLAHFCYCENISIAVPSMFNYPVGMNVIGNLMYCIREIECYLGLDIEEHRYTYVQHTLGWLMRLGIEYDIDTVEAIFTTWENVKKRNWVANPTDADKKV